MSFLAGLGGQLASGLGAAGAAGAAALPQANAAAAGLGKLIGVDPGKISSIADSVGKGMNMVAQGGGALPAYRAPEMPAVNNHMQLMDPKILQALVQYFGGQRQ